MKIPEFITSRLRRRAVSIMNERAPDFVIGAPGDDYLRRWFVIPRNRVFNIYLHHFLRSDDDRALHDHPWWNLSVLIDGCYVEHTIAQGGINHRALRQTGEFKFRSARTAHRVELNDGPCWTIFITGPRIRDWGFHCPNGWKSWQEFTKAGSPGEIGPGCDDVVPARTKPPRDRFDGASPEELEHDRRAFLGNNPLAHGKSPSQHGGSSA